jgi:glycerol-3-phosphate O-acyltransferase
MLRSKRRVRELVLGSSNVKAAIAEQARERKTTEARVAKEARGYFDEMAADFHGYYFAVLAFLFNRIWHRMFSGLDVRGLDRVVERLKQHPIVLVPCHRSHFDYLILSYIFHENFLSPPHIAAGINMAFWPFGPFFRGAGAYFIRRTFEGNPLYKSVFAAYLEYLIREGYTQEFFIEGGRSRTGKILTPKLGMLSAIVNAFTDGVRRDLFLVPVSIHYGRIVEEEAYKSELLGGQKEAESIGALIKARQVLRQRYGTVYVTFAEPISLNDALGEELKERLASHDPGVEEERRRFTQKLGFRLLREANEAAVAGATSVSSTVLLAAPNPAIRYGDFVVAARALTRLLVSKGVTLTASLHRNLETFMESVSFLQTGKLIEWMRDRDGAIIHVTTEKRSVLDFYKNNIIHFFLMPSLVAYALRRGVARPALEDEVWRWLDLFRWEFALPERAEVANEIQQAVGYFEAEGAIVDGQPNREHVLLVFGDGILENFREAYWIVAKALLDLDADGMGRKAALAAMQKSFRMHGLLGETRKPEGNSVVTFTNALSRFAELGYIVETRRGRGGREQIVLPGPAFSDLGDLERRLAESLAYHEKTRALVIADDSDSRAQAAEG